MLSYQEALDRLLAAAIPVAEAKYLPLAAARGRILAQVQHASLNVPPLDNSAMDGYAVRCADLPAAGVTLPVSQRIPAGRVGQPLQPGTAARIFTGAPVPAGADAVVMQENCVPVAGAAAVTVNHPPRLGDNIRRAGEDIASGAAILSAGTRLGAAQLGLAASVGLAQLPVWRRLRVALLSTGDELAEPGEALKPGAIYNSNRYFLTALLEQLGCAVTDLGRIADNAEATQNAFLQAAENHDLILSTGGVSVGEEDHVKAAIEALGELDLWKIAIKPGKPLAYGKIKKVGAGGTANNGSSAGIAAGVEVNNAAETGGTVTAVDFIGLPGNPVSSFVTFLIMVRPFILKRMGSAVLQPPTRQVISASDWPKPDKRREFLRARMRDDGRVELYGHQGSGVLTSCVWADGLVDCLPGQAFRAGDPVSFMAFSDLV